MSHRELATQYVYDMLELERQQEQALDSKLIADNAQLMQRLKAR